MLPGVRQIEKGADHKTCTSQPEFTLIPHMSTVALPEQSLSKQTGVHPDTASLAPKPKTNSNFLHIIKLLLPAIII